jgi:hypothetical protein
MSNFRPAPRTLVPHGDRAEAFLTMYNPPPTCRTSSNLFNLSQTPVQPQKRGPHSPTTSLNQPNHCPTPLPHVEPRPTCPTSAKPLSNLKIGDLVTERLLRSCRTPVQPFEPQPSPCPTPSNLFNLSQTPVQPVQRQANPCRTSSNLSNLCQTPVQPLKLQPNPCRTPSVESPSTSPSLDLSNPVQPVQTRRGHRPTSPTSAIPESNLVQPLFHRIPPSQSRTAPV